ncbi:hypothetical protein H6S82_09375 [Planktothrix sp. FACHB-1355]|uniref:Uncharacterized protein n=1 Tax=Aerosakkonema funiforme FACHB-1375 TaxID=2949571 RepID=A0A926ZIS2_9CYAN|nr:MULTISPECIES: hypothetical protein [Oscillatoriales]MBD2184763.1 hypothetical protein [Aerosakkonema funiforme FACHB-1375]MBD3559068.1 hypothetical protein [Planktothrix sp. FACHB-1355]
MSDQKRYVTYGIEIAREDIPQDVLWELERRARKALPPKFEEVSISDNDIPQKELECLLKKEKHKIL